MATIAVAKKQKSENLVVATIEDATVFL